MIPWKVYKAMAQITEAHHGFGQQSSGKILSACGKVIHDQNKFIMLVKDEISATGFDLADLFPSPKWLHEISWWRPTQRRM
ncbi:hypothetical protein RND71_039457 [Anisodus tanguticus]|uniref:Uncharacterized protein n=1 Tax=Anisodus tanguticus TaxID=243964 RepID=A0AAE1QX04_9SOLA|nr:hypothetical protein RND71_039457 [Anisodus tanguticus]